MLIREKLKYGTISRRIWKDVFPSLLNTIKQAEFVSFDLELTGLHYKTADRYVGFDECYEGHLKGVQKFLPVQLGFCAARRDKFKRDKWILTPFSIYVFQDSYENDFVFSSSANTLAFLHQTGVNLNEWVSEGVRWLKPSQENRRLACITDKIKELRNVFSESSNRQLDESSPSTIEIQDSNDRATIERARETLTEWLLNTEAVEPLEIPICEPFQRLLIHTVFAHEFPHIFTFTARKPDNSRTLQFFKFKENFLNCQLRSLQHEQETLKQDEVGARLLLDQISEKKCLLVGHNCFYDILHTQHHFYEELPQNLREFKSTWNSRFPFMVDTRVLCSDGGPVALKNIADYMAKDLRTGTNKSVVSFSLELIPGSKIYKLPCSISGEEHEEDLSHDAGYDSMLTALVFLMHCDKFINSRTGSCLDWDSISFPNDVSSPKGNIKKGLGADISILEILKSFVNKIKLVRTQPPVMDLTVSKMKDSTH